MSSMARTKSSRVAMFSASWWRRTASCAPRSLSVRSAAVSESTERATIDTGVSSVTDTRTELGPRP